MTELRAPPPLVRHHRQLGQATVNCTISNGHGETDSATLTIEYY